MLPGEKPRRVSTALPVAGCNAGARNTRGFSFPRSAGRPKQRPPMMKLRIVYGARMSSRRFQSHAGLFHNWNRGGWAGVRRLTPNLGSLGTGLLAGAHQGGIDFRELRHQPIFIDRDRMPDRNDLLLTGPTHQDHPTDE